MKDVIKKSILLGIGITALTKEKIEKVVKDLKKSGDINSKEGKELISFFKRESEKKHKELSKVIGKHVDAAISKAKLATKKEISIMEKKLKAEAKKAIAKGKATVKKPSNKKAKKKSLKKKTTKKKMTKKRKR